MSPRLHISTTTTQPGNGAEADSATRSTDALDTAALLIAKRVAVRTELTTIAVDDPNVALVAAYVDDGDRA